MKKSVSINGMRGITAFLIACVLHYFLVCGNPGFSNQFAGAVSYILVKASQVFFVLSGYLIAQSYELQGEARKTFVDFFKKKIIKIYPMMITSVLYIYAIQKISKRNFGEYVLYGGDEKYNIRSLILNCLGFQSGWIGAKDAVAVNGPTWFISVLFVCYFLHFFLGKLKNKKIKLIIYMLLYFFGMIAVDKNIIFPLLYGDNCGGYSGYFLGVLMAHILGPKGNPRKMRYRVCFVIYSIVLFAYIWIVRGNIVYAMSIWGWPFLSYLSIYNLAFGKICSLKLFTFLGDISMALFIWNLPIFFTIDYVRRFICIGDIYSCFITWFVVIIIDVLCTFLIHKIFDRYSFNRSAKEFK